MPDDRVQARPAFARGRHVKLIAKRAGFDAFGFAEPEELGHARRKAAL